MTRWGLSIRIGLPWSGVSSGPNRQLQLPYRGVPKSLFFPLATNRAFSFVINCPSTTS